MRKTFSLPVAATAAGGGPTPPPADTVDNIEHSVRLNSADSAQFTKTFSSAGNSTTNTISLWVKRNKISYALDTYQSFLSAGNNFIWHFDTADRLGLYQSGFIRYTTQKFRDPSAWYHFVFATDTTKSAASDQIKVYVNGQLITDWDTETALTQNTVLNWNSNVQHCIGSNNNTQFPDIQIADVQSIDGLQLTASSFGFTDSNGVWQPKAYTGDYGTEDYPGATTDSSGSFYAGRGPENLFDGSLSTLCDPAQQDGTITFSPTTGIPYSSSVEVYTGSDYPSGNYTQASVNGGTAVSVTTSNAWFTVASGPGTLNSLSLRLAGFRPNWKAIRVDGKILINSPNGFYLDFADTSSATALGNDVSGNNNDWTPNNLVAGPAYTANSFSTEFDGTGDYLTVPSSPNWTLGASGDFTVEAWVYPNSSHNSGILTTFTSWSTGFVNKWAFALAGTTLRWYLDNGGVGLTATLSVGQWSHIAASRSGSTIYLFVNGNLAGTQTANQNYSSQDRLIIGSAPGFGDFNGKISNVRIIKGRALYTAAFTPPTTALTAVTDTVLLTCQDSTFIDNSASAHTITANGDAATSTVSPFEPVDGSDAMLDSPTNYGSGDTVRGNYCTLNPLFADTYGSAVNGNVEYLNTGGAGGAIASTMAVSSGKWYYETSPTNNAYGSGNPIYPCGFLDLDIFTEFTDTFWYTAGTGFYGYYVRDGRKIVNGTISSFATSSTVNDIIGFALDLDAGELEVYKNGISLGVAATGLTGNYMPCVTSSASGQTGTVNFGQQPFKYPLAGYKSLCSTNLPTPAVADGSTAMDVALYTGTSSALAVSTPNMSPDLVWIKRRNFGWTHRLYDSIRGAGATTALYPNTTDSEGAVNAEDLDSFDSTGFTVGPASPLNGINAIGGTFVAWTWDAGSSTVTNTDGTVASQVRANPTAGISIVYVTANETTGNGGTVGHGLGKKPAFIIQKNTGATANWYIQHSGLGDMSGSYLKFTPAGKATDNTWNISEPTSSVMSIDPAYVDGDSNADVIYYVFAPVEGFSSFGTYTGSTSNTFVYTGMRPRWLMIKRTDTTSDWVILDTEREGYNVDNDPLWANLTNQEGTTDIADILSNGFKMRDGATGDYIYAAFAEHPFKTSRAR